MPFRATAGAIEPGDVGFRRCSTASSLLEAMQAADHFAAELSPPLPAYVTDVMTGERWERVQGLGWQRMATC